MSATIDHRRSAPQVGAAPSGPGENAIVVSALVVAGIYFYRRMVTPAKGVHGTPPAPLGRWLIGYGAAFFGISIVAAGSAELGAYLAILLAAGTVLTNGMAVLADIGAKTGSA